MFRKFPYEECYKRLKKFTETKNPEYEEPSDIFSSEVSDFDDKEYIEWQEQQIIEMEKWQKKKVSQNTISFYEGDSQP